MGRRRSWLPGDPVRSTWYREFIVEPLSRVDGWVPSQYVDPGKPFLIIACDLQHVDSGYRSEKCAKVWILVDGEPLTLIADRNPLKDHLEVLS